jgi:hypothetical protein
MCVIVDEHLHYLGFPRTTFCFLYNYPIAVHAYMYVMNKYLDIVSDPEPEVIWAFGINGIAIWPERAYGVYET